MVVLSGDSQDESSEELTSMERSELSKGMRRVNIRTSILWAKTAAAKYGRPKAGIFKEQQNPKVRRHEPTKVVGNEVKRLPEARAYGTFVDHWTDFLGF